MNQKTRNYYKVVLKVALYNLQIMLSNLRTNLIMKGAWNRVCLMMKVKSITFLMLIIINRNTKIRFQKSNKINFTKKKALNSKISTQVKEL
jgi:hypothetical protein